MNNSLKFGIAILLVFIIQLLSGCAKKTTDSNHVATSTFPLTEGSRWHYEGFVVLVNSSDSTETDTANLVINRCIIGPDTSLQIPGAIAYDDSIMVESHYDEIWRRWIGIQDNNLMLYALDLVVPGYDPIPTPLTHPKILLDFPLFNGKTWTSDTSSLNTVTYSVQGIEYLETPRGWSYCDVVHSVYSDNLTGDTISLAYQWYTDDGLIRYENLNLNVDPPIGSWYEKYRFFEIVNMDIQ